jgi:NADH-quinone oxidoreductase subunit J
VKIAFYIASAAAVFSTVMMITRLNLIHALIYLVLSLLSVALIFFIVGAPFVAALEVIIYAGAIMVLFVFAVMMLSFGPHASRTKDYWLGHGIWLVPGSLSALLLAEFLYILINGSGRALTGTVVGPKEVGISLFSVYLLGIELGSLLLMAGIVGAFHVGRHGTTGKKKGESK